MSDILLVTLNAGYIHASFGLRYLKANLGRLEPHSEILEFTTQERSQEIVEKILSKKPQIIGFGIYIWNVEHTTQVVTILKKVAPQINIVIGGPEVSYQLEATPATAIADYVITGEAEIEFSKLCEQLMSGVTPEKRIIYSSVPELSAITLPYQFYTDHDIKNRIIYVEASRGCPFTCEFCLSSLEIPVRQFELESFLAAMDSLIQRGVKHFKFVDRTFNLNIRTSLTILDFFLTRYMPGMFVHFEMVPDRLPEALREKIAQFPQGVLQFEVGIQTFNPQVSGLISRRQDYQKICDNIDYLRKNTGVHIHADLIVGLPGESLESFASGFNQLVALNPQEIQVGILKRLKGTPIIRHDDEWGMVYSSTAPYELLKNRLLDFNTMQRLGRFSRFWDLICNSGNFTKSKHLIWRGADGVFEGFLSWSDWLYQRTGARHAYSVKKLNELVFEFLTTERQISKEEAGTCLAYDYINIGAHDLPLVLKPYSNDIVNNKQLKNELGLPARQSKHA